MIICDSCCGCSACLQVCPRNAIMMKKNNVKERIAFVDETKCVGCGICKKVCPRERYINNDEPRQCYAAWGKNKEDRLDCSSGGIANVLYSAFITLSDSALVIGVERDEEGNYIYVATNDCKVIQRFKGSKYTQADADQIYKTIEQALSDNKEVLFVGLPCHIAACYKYLAYANADIDKLYTVDLLCHGVSPKDYLDEELEYLKAKYKWSNISNITFRSNRKFRNFHLYIEVIDKNGKSRIYNRYAYEDPYFASFLNGLSLRNSCCECKYADVKRVGDISLGDFIGLGSDRSFPKWEGDSYNSSLVLVNSAKGELLLNIVRDQVLLYERPLAEAVKGGLSLRESIPKHNKRHEFELLLNEYGFVNTVRRILFRKSLKTIMLLRIKRFIKGIALKLIK